MKISIVAALIAAVAASTTLSAAPIAPDTYNVNVKNLYPEDAVFDRTRGLLYQSNLWKGRISVTNTGSNSHFNVLIPGVSSTGDGSQQLAGLSINNRLNANRLYAVAKDAGAFRFGPSQSKNGACSFHAFNLPVSDSSKPAWSVYFDAVQKQFAAKYGTRPFGPVDSAQDNQGNSYVVFALGIPAIAKISSDGKNVQAWFAEQSNGSQRPGYTGVQFDPTTNTLIAYGGPRALTAFDLGASTPTARNVQINGNFGTLDGTEKLTLVPYKGKQVLIGARAPDAIAFTSTDKWNSASVKSFSRSEFKSNSLTVITELGFNNGQQIYGAGAYFGEGAKGGRTAFPLYKVPNSLMT